MARQAIKTLKHFKRDELGYNPEYVDVKLMYGLDMLRDSVDAPFITGDLYATRGHIATGYHPRGMAADGFFKSKMTLEEEYSLVNWWTGGVIVYPFWRRPGFHFDTGPKRRLWRAANGSYHNIVGIERPWIRWKKLI